jgi:serine protease AprX
MSLIAPARKLPFKRLLLFVLPALVALIAFAGSASAAPGRTKAYVPDSLLAQMTGKPGDPVSVIVQGTFAPPGLLQKVTDSGGTPGRSFTAIQAVTAKLTAGQLRALANVPGITAITPDAPVKLTAYSSKQKWPYVSGVFRSWSGFGGGLQAPAIAIVDSGIDATRSDFGGRVVEQVNLTTRQPNSPGDGRGHGTFVAGIAAGGADGYSGAAPGARLVGIDVIDDTGVGSTSDVIAACDWILANKDRLGIRVANFSLHNSDNSSVFWSPLDRAVERLWFAGVTVVASAGNYGTGDTTTIRYAPGNDPFVITVGAADTERSVATNDDYAAPWSVHGYTLDGFAKPELGAPGRYLVGPVSSGATMAAERPDKVVAPGYMQLSGTSFSAPVVAGAAAYLLALHPSWTPDQVKGALMLTAKQVPTAAPGSLGVGEVDAGKAADVFNPPNPNAALNPFVVADPAGGSLPVFDTASWSNAAHADASWSNASWSDASWSNASWSNASWSNASWSNASWATASWSDASWSDASWSDASASDSSAENAAAGEGLPEGGDWVTDAEIAAAQAEYQQAG